MRVAILLLMLSSCAPYAGRRWTLEPRSEVGTWHELRSSRYVYYSDEDVAVARTKLMMLERITSLVGMLYSRGPDPRTTLMVVIAQGFCDQPNSGRGARGGYVTASRTGESQDFLSRQVVYACGGTWNLDLQVPVHLRLHDLAARFAPNLPPWLDEGLAWYFAGARMTPAGLQVGHAPMGYFRGPRKFAPPKQVRAMTRKDFEGSQEKRWAAWALVSTLIGDHAETLQVHLDALADPSKPSPWSGVDDEVLDDAMDTLSRRGPKTVRLIQAPTKDPAIEVRQLGNGEALALWVQVVMLSITDATPELDGVLEQVEIANRADPSADVGLFWKAVLAWRFPRASRDSRGAEQLLRAYLARHPTDERALIGIVRIDLDGFGASLNVLDPTPPAGLARMDGDVARLAAVASTERGLDTVALAHALAHRPADGLPYARRAVVTAPDCTDCLDTLAVLAFQAGRRDEALTTIQRAIHLSGNRDVERTTRYAAHLAAFRAAPSPEPTSEPPTSAPTSLPTSVPAGTLPAVTTEL